MNPLTGCFNQKSSNAGIETVDSARAFGRNGQKARGGAMDIQTRPDPVARKHVEFKESKIK